MRKCWRSRASFPPVRGVRSCAGLKTIEAEIEQGDFQFSPADEDIHMNIERRLTEKIGPAGGMLHTARSRNDQVALDMRLFLREEVQLVIDALIALQREIASLAKRHIDVIMPGYTHLQRAQPVLFAHHLFAYYDMFDRDRQRFVESLKRINVLPLGSGALAGTTFPIDRAYRCPASGFPANLQKQHRRGQRSRFSHRVSSRIVDTFCSFESPCG